MKHNKYGNIGVIFEVLNNAVLNEIASGNNDKAKRYLNVLFKYFLKETEIRKTWKIYSQLLYNQASNHLYAERFMNSLVKETSAIDRKRLVESINALYEDISRFVNKKAFMKTKTPNYKLFASFSILTENENLSSVDKYQCERQIMEHLVNNQEAQRLHDASTIYEIDDLDADEEQLQRLAENIMINKFYERYGNRLNEDQNTCIVKYFTSDDKAFSRWCEKKSRKVVKEITEKLPTIDNGEIRDKMELVCEKLQDFTADNDNKLLDLLMSFRLVEQLKLF